MCCSEPLLWLEGGPYSAGALVPPSAATAVLAKSTGICCDHCLTVLGGSSGEEKRIVSRTASSAITPIATTSSLIRSYGAYPPSHGPVSSRVRSGFLMAVAPRPRVHSGRQLRRRRLG